MDCPHFETPAVIEDIEKHPNLTFWQSRLNDIDKLIPFVPLEVYLFAKANGYDIVEKTIYNGVSVARTYKGEYKIYIAKKSNIIGYDYIFVKGKEIRFGTEKEYSELLYCFPHK